MENNFSSFFICKTNPPTTLFLPQRSGALFWRTLGGGEVYVGNAIC